MDPLYLDIHRGGQTLRIAHASRQVGPDLVFFIHGLGCSMETFAAAWDSPHMKRLSLLAPDLPGFGLSSKPDDFDYTMENHAGVCLELLKATSQPRIHIVAHSMGGAIGLLLAGDLGPRLASFINVEGNLVTEDCTVSRKVASAGLGRYRSQLLEHLRIITAHSLDRGLVHWYENVKRSGETGLNKSALSLVEHSCSGRLLELYLGLACRSVFVYGARNAAIPVLKKLGHAPAIAIGGSGHFPMVDNPGEFYARVASFIVET